ncbi:MAG: hypothetical protein IPL53_01925 [Ignavibacteria bacterium]|nr:hypothetical protein [Ignavibacteria bacterium]
MRLPIRRSPGRAPETPTRGNSDSSTGHPMTRRCYEQGFVKRFCESLEFYQA